jgi:hypothetical protein
MCSADPKKLKYATIDRKTDLPQVQNTRVWLALSQNVPLYFCQIRQPKLIGKKNEWRLNC